MVLVLNTFAIELAATAPTYCTIPLFKICLRLKRRSNGTDKGADVSQWFQRFVASGIHGKVSDATIQGYLRSASQISEVWQQIDDNVDALIAQGIPPWDAYAKMGFALAFVRACRTNVVCVQELLKADAAEDPTNAGYLPKVTYDQALALSEHIEPLLEEAIKASTNPHYVPTGFSFPLLLGPHIRYANQPFPLPHLQGVIGATQQMRDWAAGLLAKYELALNAAKTAIPQEVSTHLEEMKSELKLGDFHLGTGVDMVGQLSKGQVTSELNEKAEGFLWEAMESFFKVSQLVAIPKIPAPSIYRGSGVVVHKQYQERHASPRQNPVIPVQPTPNTTDLLNQIIASPSPTQATPSQPPSDTSDLLNQVIAGPTPTQAAPSQPTSDTSDLLSQVTGDSGTAQVQPSTKESRVVGREQSSVDNLLDEICGEQKEDQ